MQITTIGLDIAKNVFQVHGIDAAEKVVVRKQLRRGQMMKFFAALQPHSGVVVDRPVRFGDGAYFEVVRLPRNGWATMTRSLSCSCALCALSHDESSPSRPRRRLNCP
jgi:hypothetical protein